MSPRRKSSSAPSLGPIDLVILGLFFFSGASALVYEVVWSRLLTYTFGGSAFAIATVLAAYMAGLALGSAWFGRIIDRKGHPLRVYGLLEGAIGLWALLFPFVLDGLDSLYALMYQSMNMGSLGLNAVRFIFCFGLLLIPTTMMGGTLPILGKLLLNSPTNLGSRAGLLYGINTLGAVVGVAAGGFLLVPFLGLSGATGVAVLINVVIALAAVMLAKKVPYQQPAAQENAKQESALPLNSLRKAVLFLYAASGFAALAYEVVWVKVLSMILGNTTYAFTAMLTTFLLGLALGAFVFGKIADRFGKTTSLLIVVQTAIPVFALLTIPLLERLPEMWVNGFEAASSSWFGVELFRFSLAALVMFVPALLMGGTFPLVTRVFVDKKNMGGSLGTLYAANTVGAILGSSLTGFVLVPLLGRQNSILTATLVNLAAAVVLLSVVGIKKLPPVHRWVTGVLLVSLLGAGYLGIKPWDPVTMASGAYYYPVQIKEKGSIEEYFKDGRLIFYKESTEAAISVFQNLHIKSLRMNGKIDASTHGDRRTQKLLAHIAGLYHGGRDQETVVIGLASGITVGSLLTYPVKQVDCVELVKGVEEAAAKFSEYNRDCLNDPRFNLIINDGRNQLRLSEKTYDIIISQPTNPWIAGVGALFTKEFYQLTKDRLNPGGVACLWIQLYHMREQELQAALGTFLDEFPYVQAWYGNPTDLMLVGSMEPKTIDLDLLRNYLGTPVGEDLEFLEVLPPENMFGYFITDQDGLRQLVGAESRRVTDDNLYLEYSIPRNMYTTEGLFAPSDFRRFLSSPALAMSPADPMLAAGAKKYQTAHMMTLEVLNGRAVRSTAADSPFRRALVLAPESALARKELGHDLNEQGLAALSEGNLAAAKQIFWDAARASDKAECSLAWNNLGYIAFAEGLHDSARVYWQRAQKCEPFHPNVAFNLGILYSSSKEYDAAAKQYEIALAADPDNADVLNNFAFSLGQSGQHLDRAANLAERAVELDRNSNTLDTLGWVLALSGSWDKAQTALAEAVQLDGTNGEAWLHLGEAQIGAGNKAAAKSSLERAIQAGNQTVAQKARQLLESM